MFALLSRRLRRWLLIAVGVPLAAWLLERVGAALHRRNPHSRAGRTLRDTGAWLRGARPRRGRFRTRAGW